MPSAHRMGDCNTGDGCVTTIPQSTVFINNKLACVNGSKGTKHDDDVSHDAGVWETAHGCTTVKFENTPANHQGNEDTCLHSRADGSPNVSICDPSSPPIVVSVSLSVLFVNNPPEPVRPSATSPSQASARDFNLAHPEQYNTPNNAELETTNAAEFPPEDPIPPPEPSAVVDCEGGEPPPAETATEHPDISARLSQILSEAERGEWRENGNNPNIIATYKDVGNPQRSDQVAWCAGFVGSVLKRSCHKFIKGNLAAGAFTNYGNPVPLSEAKRGDIIVFNRDAGTGHVAFYWGPGDRPGTIAVVGGNQSNNVTLNPHAPISLIKPNGVQRPTRS